MLYGLFYMQPQYREGSDSIQLFTLSCTETDRLLQHPVDFIKDFFTSGYREESNLFISKDSYWNDLKNNTLVKLVAVINLFTGKRYFVNVIFINFLFFFGPIALFRLLKTVYPNQHRILIAGIFMVPSFVFWCSGLHKDGFIFLAIALAVYFLYQLNNNHKQKLKYMLLLACCLLLLFAFRNFLFFLLLPAFAGYLLAIRYPSYKNRCFAVVYLVAVALFFLLPYLHPAFNFPQYLAGKQAEFRDLSGASGIPVPVLHPTAISIAAFLPYALDIALLRPHLTEIKNLAYLPAALENLAIVLLLIFTILRYKTGNFAALILLLICFSCSALLMTGYTVTFSAAVMRYKSILLPLFVPVLLASQNWKLPRRRNIK